MTKLTFILLLFSLLSCTSSKKENEEVKNDSIPSNSALPDQIAYKISSNKDSVVLINPPPFHFGIQIFRNGKKILDYSNKDLQINSIDGNGKNSNWFTEFTSHNERFYIIRVFNGPEPDQFLILKITDSNAIVFGITEPNSAETFGDVDNDGKFEIGGLTLFCQGGDPNCHPEDHCRVFEIASNFPTDTALTDSLKQSFKKR